MGTLGNKKGQGNAYFDSDGLIVNPEHGGTGDAVDTSTPLNPEMQAKANKPAIDPSGFDQETKDFLRTTMAQVMDGKIDTYKPSSLLKLEVYEQMDESAQADADQTAFLFCNKLREIKGLMDISGGDKLYAEPTYQIKHLVAELKFYKEEYEKAHGDVFVI